MFLKSNLSLVRDVISITVKNFDRRASLLCTATVGAGVLASAFGICGPLFLQSAIDQLATSSGKLYEFVTFLVACLIAERVCQSLLGTGTAVLSQHMNYNLGKFYVDSLVNVPVAKYSLHSPQEVVEILQTARNSNQVIVTSVAGTILPTLIKFTSACIVLLYLGDIAIIVSVFLYTAIYSVITTRITAKLSGLFSSAIESSMLTSRFLGDIASNVVVIKVFDAWKLLSVKYNNEQQRLQERWSRYFRTTTSLDTFRALTFGMLLAVCLLKAIADVKTGKSSVGHFVLVNAYVIQICSPIDMMLKTISNTIESLRGYVPFLRFTETSKERLTEPMSAMAFGPPTIEFRQVSFSYPGKTPIFENMSFTIDSGKLVALIGATGAGKSTILKLLLGLESCTSGSILINNRDIKTLAEGDLYRIVSYVPQETYIFHDTLAFNLRIGKPDATNSELAQAICAAQLSEFIEKLPEGIETEVGDRGLNLSGGERQRVAIARALLRDAKVLVIDEGTSALDEATEANVLKALRPTSEGHIVITVAHRASAIAVADQVHSLKHGILDSAEVIV